MSQELNSDAISANDQQLPENGGRPRRQVRPAKRLPQDYAMASSSSSTGAVAEGEDKSSLRGRESGQGRGRGRGRGKTTARNTAKGKGKRAVESDGAAGGSMDELDLMDVDENTPFGQVEGKTKANGKARKLYDLDFILTSSKSPLVSLDILVRYDHVQAICNYRFDLIYSSPSTGTRTELPDVVRTF